MITCNEHQVSGYLEEGYFVVEMKEYVSKEGKPYKLFKVADPKKICVRELRGGEYCQLDKGHKGRCSSVTFYCDGCNKYRRGQPYRIHRDVAALCFMCVAVTPYAKSKYPRDYVGEGF